MKEIYQELCKEKEPIKKAIEYNIQRKEKIRQIESLEKRTVHFIFNPELEPLITPFSRKLLKLLDGSLEEVEKEEQEKFQQYVERLENQELEENE